MIEKIGKQENLPENMGIIPILKLSLVVDTIYFFPKFSLTPLSVKSPYVMQFFSLVKILLLIS